MTRLLCCQGTDINNDCHYDAAILSVRALPAKLNPPKFLDQRLDVSIVENTDLGSPIALAAAIDNDPVRLATQAVFSVALNVCVLLCLVCIWLVGWLAGWVTGWMVGWLVG